MRRRMWNVIKSLNTDRCVILTTHLMEEVGARASWFPFLIVGLLACLLDCVFFAFLVPILMCCVCGVGGIVLWVRCPGRGAVHAHRHLGQRPPRMPRLAAAAARALRQWLPVECACEHRVGAAALHGASPLHQCTVCRGSGDRYGTRTPPPLSLSLSLSLSRSVSPCGVGSLRTAGDVRRRLLLCVTRRVSPRSCAAVPRTLAATAPDVSTDG